MQKPEIKKSLDFPETCDRMIANMSNRLFSKYPKNSLDEHFKAMFVALGAFFLVWIVWAVICLATLGGIIWVAWHFISKYW